MFFAYFSFGKLALIIIFSSPDHLQLVYLSMCFTAFLFFCLLYFLFSISSSPLFFSFRLWLSSFLVFLLINRSEASLAEESEMSIKRHRNERETLKEWEKEMERLECLGRGSYWFPLHHWAHASAFSFSFVFPIPLFSSFDSFQSISISSFAISHFHFWFIVWITPSTPIYEIVILQCFISRSELLRTH